MRSFDFLLPRTRTGRALLVTFLYALLALFALHAPISRDAPFVRLFGSQDLARDAMVSFAQLLFWPVAGALAIAACESWLYTLLRRSGGQK